MLATDLWYNILIFLSEDPRKISGHFLEIEEEVLEAKVIAFVTPYAKSRAGHYRDIPIITWEEPSNIRLRAMQYAELYKITKAEAIVLVGWPYVIPGGSEAGMIHISPLTVQTLSGRSFSKLVHIKLHGK